MKLKNFINSIREKLASERSDTYILVSSGLTGFFIIFVLNSVIGIYSVFGTSSDLSENFSGINTARSAQCELYEQVNSWSDILDSQGRYPQFQSSYLEFSRRAESVQNMLFNLKLQYTAEREIASDLERLMVVHKKMTYGIITSIAEMENAGFKNVRGRSADADEIQHEIILALNDIAGRIEKTGERKTMIISGRYIFSFAVTSVIFIMLLVYYGKRTGRRLLKTHEILESEVAERTLDYVEANLSLKKEIEEHCVTEQKLVSSKIEIEEKNRLLAISEKKYRQIVEGTKDVIFTLDGDWYFKSANDAVKAQMRISPDSVTKFRFTDLIYDDLTDATMLRKIITEKLEASRRDNSPMKFSAQIKTPNLIEPVEFRISLEFVEIEGNSEIIGKAERLTENMFSDSFISEKCEYMIRNLLFEADDITHRITENLCKYIDRNEVNMVRLGLREMIINSIEHGNLNISFEEKTEAIMTDRYFEFINERQAMPDNMEKRVRIEFMITPERAVYKISDQGRGFNHRKHLSGLSDEANASGLAHGRGITMVMGIFDEVRYNSKGNQVLLVKRLRRINAEDDSAAVNGYAGVEHAEIC